MKHIVIVGGGIAGLGAAYKIRRAADAGADVSFTLVEKDDRIGGKIFTDIVYLPSEEPSRNVVSDAEQVFRIKDYRRSERYKRSRANQDVTSTRLEYEDL